MESEAQCPFATEDEGIPDELKVHGGFVFLVLIGLRGFMIGLLKEIMRNALRESEKAIRSTTAILVSSVGILFHLPVSLCSLFDCCLFIPTTDNSKGGGIWYTLP